MYKSGENYNLLRVLLFTLILFFFITLNFSQNYKIDNITIIGNNYFKEEKLKDRLKLKKGDLFYNSILQEDIAELNKFYEENGFFNKQISTKYSIKNQKVFIEYQIFEGKQSFLKQIIADQQYDSIVKKYLSSRYTRNKLNTIKSEIINKLNNKGFFKPVVDIKDISDNDFEKIIKIKVKPGEKYYFGQLYISGLTNIKEKAIFRRKNFEKGDLFSKSKVIKFKEELYKLNVFSDLSIKYYETDSNNIDIFLDVKEDKFKWIGMNIGYTTPATTRLGFEWGNNNFLNNLLVVKLNNENEYDFENDFYKFNLDLSLIKKWFLFKKLDLNNSIGMEFEKDSKSKNSKIYFQSNLIKEISEDFTLQLGYEKKLTFYEEIETEEAEENIDKWLTANNIIAKVYFDNIKRKINPVNDSLYISFYNRLSGGFIGGDWRYYYHNIESAIYKNLYKNKFITLLHLNYKKYFEFNNELLVPYDELISLGGVYDIRGYNYSGIGDNFYSSYVFNLAERIKLYRNLWVELFLDGGKGFRKNREFNLTNIKYSTGLEFRYLISILVFRVGYAKKITDKGSLIYFSLGQMF